MREGNNRGHCALTVITMMALLHTWSLYNQPLVDKHGWELSLQYSLLFRIMSLALAVAVIFSSKLQASKVLDD